MEHFVFSIRSEFRSLKNGDVFNGVDGHQSEASRSKGESRKGSKNPVSCSKKYPDAVACMYTEIDRSEFRSYDIATSSNQNTRVPFASYAFSSYDNIRNGLGWICVDLHGFESEDSEDSDFVAGENNPYSVSVGESSSNSKEEVDEVNTEELNAENESGKSEDEGECGEKEALKRKYISGEDPMVEEIVIFSNAVFDELSICGDVESQDRPRNNGVKRKKLNSEGDGDIRQPINECHVIDERVHKKRPSIAMKRGETIKKRRISAEKSVDIINSILVKGKKVEEKVEEAKQPLSDIKGIPLMFRFDDVDESPRKVEKSEFDLMVDDLFAEMEYALKCEEINFSELPEVGNEKEEDDTATEVNHILLCSRGRHQPFFDEQIGLICHFCKQLLLESKYVLPPLVMNLKAKLSERTYDADRKDIPTTFNDLKQKVSGDNSEGFFYHTEGKVWDVISGTVERMYPHQQEGFEFLWKKLMGTISLLDLKNSDPNGVGGCIISHAPGTCKTRLTLVFLESFLKVYPHSLCNDPKIHTTPFSGISKPRNP